MEWHGPPRFPTQSIHVNDNITRGMYPIFYYHPPPVDYKCDRSLRKSVTNGVDAKPAATSTKKRSYKSQKRQSKGKQSETTRRAKESTLKKQVHAPDPHMYTHPLYPSLSVVQTQQPPQFLGTCIAISPKVVITAGHHYTAKTDDVGSFVIGMPQMVQETKYLARRERYRRRKHETTTGGCKDENTSTISDPLLRLNLSLSDTESEDNMMYGIRAKYAQKKPDLDLCVFWLEEPLPFFTTRMRLFSPLATHNPVSTNFCHSAGIKEEKVEDNDDKQFNPHMPCLPYGRSTSQYYGDVVLSTDSGLSLESYISNTVISPAKRLSLSDETNTTHTTAATSLTPTASQPVQVATVYYKPNHQTHRDIVVSCGVVIECLRRGGTSVRDSGEVSPPGTDHGITVACIVRGTISEKGCSGAPVVDVTGNYILGLHIASNKTKVPYNNDIYNNCDSSAYGTLSGGVMCSTVMTRGISETGAGFSLSSRSVLPSHRSSLSPSSQIPHQQQYQSSRTSEFITSAAILAAMLILEIYLYPRNEYVGFNEDDDESNV